MFSQMLAQMTQQAGGGGEAGQNPFAAMGAMGGSGAGGGNPFAPQQQTPQPIEPKTFLDKVFPLIHLVSMVALAVYAVVWIEPSRRFGLYGSNEVKGIDWNAWGSLASRRPRDVGAVGQAIGASQLGQVVSPLFPNSTRNVSSLVANSYAFIPIVSASFMDVRYR